ncbi:MAG: hypothetical protein K0R93_2057 [Anaerosolibacter sp.]|jgi:hypothetical protein|uniref:CBO0543 family protein n=1 Tax=Anaerosolibacter sp. TaxID=1872527 RepID=UPI002639F67D|nr:CBO0543 family protein [Anaerosolibacter sp.]MDF2547159.1 hypothetical protein [Anaerosolibacter sp.]
MWIHALVSIFPWALFWIVSDKSRLRRLFITGTFGSMIALIVDIFQHSFRWWTLEDDIIPRLDIELSADLGLYPVQAMLLVQFLPDNKRKWPYWIIGLSCFNTAGEYILHLLGELVYTNGWNYGWTFLSYLIPFSLVAWHSTYYES